MKKERILNYVEQTSGTSLSKIEITLKVKRESLNTIKSALEQLIEDSHNAYTIRSTCYLIEEIEEILKTSTDEYDKEEL